MGRGRPALRDASDLPRRRTLLDCDRELGLGARVNAAVYRVCIEDPPIAAVAPVEIESLRYGLNAIARWLR
jgi:hypothetical protein